MATNLGKGPAKGIALEELKKAALLKDFISKLTFRGQAAFLRKFVFAVAWLQRMMTVQSTIQYRVDYAVQSFFGAKAW